MNGSMSRRIALVVPAALLASALGAAAQNIGTITGTVSDPQGLPVPGATVTLLNRISQTTQETVTAENGGYSLGNVPFGIEMGEPEDIAPMVCFLLSDKAREVTGQVYTVNAGRVAVWNQPVEVREMRKDGRWTVDELAARFDEVGQEPMPILDRLKEMENAAKAGDKPNQ